MSPAFEAMGSLFFQLFCDAIQRLVGKFGGRNAILPVEVEFEAPTHFEITLAVGVHPFIEPSQKLFEGFFVRCPVLVRSHCWPQMPAQIRLILHEPEVPQTADSRLNLTQILDCLQPRNVFVKLP